MQWNFRPQQPVLHVHPGETALAFYTAKNPTDRPIDGISTYNVLPFEAGQYFNKIQERTDERDVLWKASHDYVKSWIFLAIFMHENGSQRSTLSPFFWNKPWNKLI